jgi:GNAT superfamily N-acetyltransferase
MLELNSCAVTKKHWPDMERLFGERGACGGCWCMFWRQTRSEFEKNKGSANKRAMKKVIWSGQVPGVLAFDGDDPVGWCSVAPREEYSSLNRSRVLKAIDGKPVWSIVCLFIDKRYRNRGVSVELIKAAVRYATGQGATIIEGYPAEPKKKRWPDAFAYMGLPSAFLSAGFKEVLRRSSGRPIMRFIVTHKQGDK